MWVKYFSAIFACMIMLIIKNVNCEVYSTHTQGNREDQILGMF